MLDRFISALVAVSLAILVWLYASSREQEMLDNVTIPVRIGLAANQAEHYDLEINGPSQVAVSFTGTPSRIRELRGLLQRGQMQVEMTISVPEERQQESRYLDTVLVTPSDVHAPPGVTAVVVEGRNRIAVTLRKLVERRLPVRLNLANEDRLAQTALEPTTVAVRGPEEILDRLRLLATEPFPLPPAEALPGQSSVVAGTATFPGELEGRPIHVNPSIVGVKVTLKPKQKVYVLNDMPIHFLCPANFALRPKFVGNERSGRAALRLLGPASEESPGVAVFIDLTRRKFAPGLYADEPLQVQLPKDFQLEQNPLRSPAFKLEELPAGTLKEAGLGSGAGLQ